MPQGHHDTEHPDAILRASIDAGAPRRTRAHSRRWLVTGIAALVVLVLLALAVVLSPWDQVAAAIAAANPALLTLALLASLAVYPLWVWQWRLIAGPFRLVRWPVMAQVVALSLGARFTLSGLGGVASGGAALHGHAELSPAEAASVMMVDQMQAGFAKLVVLALALALAPVPPAVRTASLALGAALIAATVLLVMLPRFRRPLTAVPLTRLGAAIRRFSVDLERLGSLRVLLPTSGLALVKKALEVAAAYAIQRALGVDGTLALAILAVASVSLVTLLPLAPVHLGPQALAVFTTYAVLGTPTGEAISVAVLHQALMLVSTLIIGAVSLALATRPALAKPRP